MGGFQPFCLQPLSLWANSEHIVCRPSPAPTPFAQSPGRWWMADNIGGVASSAAALARNHFAPDATERPHEFGVWVGWGGLWVFLGCCVIIVCVYTFECPITRLLKHGGTDYAAFIRHTERGTMAPFRQHSPHMYACT